MSTPIIVPPSVVPVAKAPWKQVIERYQRPSTWRALWQLINTFVPYALLWYLMHLSVALSWWLTVPLAVVAGALLMRIFIIFHDCGHGSYFKSHWANDTLGFIAGVLTFTPYYQWRWEHAIHHGSAGQLDHRGTGDIWTMTVQEYLESSRWRRFAYQLARNPFILFVVAPLYMFLIGQRLPSSKRNRREHESVWWMNLALLCMVIGMSWMLGIKQYVLLQLMVMAVAGAGGVWLFYMQHQFEAAYWERGDDWDYAKAALQGSSFYKLPRILQWFSGNIGFHHIHHLSPRVPNYNLQRCHEAEPLFLQVKPMTLFSSLKSLTLRLWDEKAQRLVGYGRMRQLRRQQKHKPAARHEPPKRS
jgi:acyl-lipid omega-6 desaturase (Delta-12 desaturase)